MRSSGIPSFVAKLTWYINCANVSWNDCKWASLKAHHNSPNNSLGVVPGFPRRTRINTAIDVISTRSILQETAIKPKRACFIISFPLVTVPRDIASPDSNPTSLHPSSAAPHDSSVVLVVVGFQRNEVPLFHDIAIGPWSRHPLIPGLAAATNTWANCGSPVFGGDHVTRSSVTVQFRTMAWCSSCAIVVIEAQISQTLRCLPNLHPQAVSRSALFWLKPGNSWIHKLYCRHTAPRARLSSCSVSKLANQSVS